jgi:hypothetical protein
MEKLVLTNGTHINSDYIDQSTLTSIDALTLNGLSAASLVPIGTIIAVHSGMTGGDPYDAPDSNVWAECNGLAYPGYRTGITPDLTDNRFLIGTSTSGTTAGSTNNTAEITDSHMVSHAHTSSSIANHQHGINLYHTHFLSGTSPTLYLNNRRSTTSCGFGPGWTPGNYFTIGATDNTPYAYSSEWKIRLASNWNTSPAFKNDTTSRLTVGQGGHQHDITSPALGTTAELSLVSASGGTTGLKYFSVKYYIRYK